jgi:hypothetical protein
MGLLAAVLFELDNIPEAMRGKGTWLRGKLGFWWIMYRIGLLCMLAFAIKSTRLF